MPSPDTKLTVKCSSADLELWKEAAHIQRTTLSEWVRKVLNANAEKTAARPAVED